MERLCFFEDGEFYHLYNRGVDKRIIFKQPSDYRRFLKLMYACNSSQPVVYRDLEHLPFGKIDRGYKLISIGAYCLMPNHFHILIRQDVEGGISVFMKKLLTGYSMYFNKKYNRTGVLFQSRFRSQWAGEDSYLEYLYAYIHLNPVRKLLDQNKLDEARISIQNNNYSSYEDYLGSTREESIILDRENFPDYFNKVKDFSDFIDDWFKYNEYYTIS
ncbi:MAG: hypothetical protein A2589_03385 [Candidatus Vogelbacteria bacterium RIFOXYD1_FULL_46_19]|uniref:Transposase IS200-like domain-containing protein n=1 Tax=Candidatus Vogelbacteria bacterium RIFOXYD1_FULL_46_19 TaxID=1802439 RepID=A0A1G2QFD0_9BACT|nr:MAG: hypothetical protein A2589_03385 [Candidatus Vogelbacteria bacterium RIFOXYD1_FULL_46_19]